jgi:hypothetical protein
MNPFRAPKEGVNVAVKLDRQCRLYPKSKSGVSGQSDYADRVGFQPRVNPEYKFNITETPSVLIKEWGTIDWFARSCKPIETPISTTVFDLWNGSCHSQQHTHLITLDHIIVVSAILIHSNPSTFHGSVLSNCCFGLHLSHFSTTIKKSPNTSKFFLNLRG